MEENKNNKTIEIFQNASVPKAVINNVVPSIISMIMVLVYNLADTFFIGKTNNAFMVAAVSVATPAFLIFMAIGMLFGIGGTSLISRMLGEKREERAKHASSFCFWTGLCVGILSMLLMFVFATPVCRAIGASDDTVEYATTSLRIVSLGIPFLILSNSFSNIIRAEGRAKTAMSGMIIGNLANIILDPIMILYCGWDVAGAAIATVIGNVLSAVFYFIHLISKKSMLSIHPKDYRIGGRIALDVFAIGIPASLNSILMSVSNIIINKLISGFGDMAVAGLGVAMKVNMIVVMRLIGLGVGISAVMTAICYFGASPLVRAFLEDEHAFSYGFSFSRIYILSGPILGLMFVFINAIQATGAALPSLILSISRQGLIFIPILMIINELTDSARALVFAQPLPDYIATALAAVLLLTTCKKRFKVTDKEISE